MRILLAISETPPRRSGVARIAGRLNEGFAAAGHDVDLLSVEDVGRVTIGEMRLTGLTAHWRELQRRIAAADLVSVFGPAPTFSDGLLLMLALSRRRTRPAVVYTHVFDIDFASPYLKPATALYNWTHRQLARAADRVVVPTPSYAAEFVALGKDVAVIPWGIDRPVSTSREAKDKELTVLFVGQLRPYKGISTLIRAAARIPHALVLIAGDGPERQRLQRQAEAQGAFNVRFLGGVSDAELENLYGRAHVVVLPSVSRLEAFGITLVEGMAAGCVPVASYLRGVRDVVADVGYTFAPGDADALAGLLASLNINGEDWQSRSRRARERSLLYSWAHTVSSHLGCYESLLDARSLDKSALDELPLASRSRS